MVFPAHAGMSPLERAYLDVDESFPRTRGDEPYDGNLFGLSSSFPRTRGDEPQAILDLGFTDVFSPHTRG